MEREKAKLEHTCKQTKDSLQSMQDENNSLREKLELQRQTQVEYQRSYDALQNETAEHAKMIEEEKAKLEHACNETKDSLKTLRDENRLLKEKVESQSRTQAEVQGLYESLQNENMELMKRLEQKEKEHHQALMALGKDFEQKLEQAEFEHQATVASMTVLQGEEENKVNELKEMDRKHQEDILTMGLEFKRKLEQRDKKQQEGMLSIGILQGENRDLRGKIDKLQKDVEIKRDRIKKLETMLDHISHIKIISYAETAK